MRIALIGDPVLFVGAGADIEGGPAITLVARVDRGDPSRENARRSTA